MSGSVIVAGARTPVGRLLGGLKSQSAADLGGVAIKGALEKAGVGAAVDARVVSRELNVRQVATKVALGEAEAGIVYRTDVSAFGDRLEAVPVAAGDEVVARYPVAALRDAPHPALARAFARFLLGPRAQALLREAGFLPPGAHAP